MNESVDPDQAHLDLHIFFQMWVKNFEKRPWYSIIPIKGINSYTENTKFLYSLSPKSYYHHFQGKFNFEGLFKKALLNSSRSTFLACAYPIHTISII